jgi:hypothetical protein
VVGGAELTRGCTRAESEGAEERLRWRGMIKEEILWKKRRKRKI